MCGIYGYFSSRDVIDEVSFIKNLDLINHRGPDDSGVWKSKDSKLMIGHKRLSIFDLSDAGKQPMVNEDNGDIISFNGEIYNFKELREELIKLGHSFMSSSDTEVILKAYQEWKEDTFTKLNGMFSLAIFDSERKKLVLARDRAGEKPLYFFSSDNEFGFASELKPLISNKLLKKRIDKRSLDCFLSFGYSPRQSSIFENINKLEPGFVLSYDLSNNSFEKKTYWSLKKKLTVSSRKTANDEDYFVDKLEHLLEESISLQLEADVPVGVLLSGGLDSSLITSIASRKKNLRTFTVKFSEHASFDESKHAELIAKEFNTNHTELEASSISPNIIEELVKYYDEPMLDSSMIPTFLLSKEVRKHCKVAIGGDGGDELFGGYKHYDRLIRLSRIANVIPLSSRKFIGEISQFILPIGFKGRNWAHTLSKNFNNSVPQISVFFNYYDRKKLLKSDSITENFADTYREESFIENSSILDRATFFDFMNYLSEDILVKVDRASMASSLETRAPFLDYRLIEFAFLELPNKYKATSSQRKIILKKLAKKILPKEFDLKRKQGFSLPLSKFFKDSSWKEFIESKLFDKNVIFNESYLKYLYSSLDKDRSNSERIFGLVLFNTWLEKYNPNK